MMTSARLDRRQRSARRPWCTVLTTKARGECYRLHRHLVLLMSPLLDTLDRPLRGVALTRSQYLPHPI